MNKIEEIHNSLVNGQRKQAMRQIDEESLYDFWEDYKDFLKELYPPETASKYFYDCVISYFRIKNR